VFSYSEIAISRQQSAFSCQARKLSVIGYHCSVLASLSFTVFRLSTLDFFLLTLDHELWAGFLLLITHHDLRVCVPGIPRDMLICKTRPRSLGDTNPATDNLRNDRIVLFDVKSQGQNARSVIDKYTAPGILQLG